LASFTQSTSTSPEIASPMAWATVKPQTVSGLPHIIALHSGVRQNPVQSGHSFGRRKTLSQPLMAATVAHLTLLATKTGQMNSRGGFASDLCSGSRQVDPGSSLASLAQS
jgi:hypothetical protein